MAGKREEQMKEITERLEQGVKDLFTSEKYTEYLKTMSQFHNYSFNNTLLIALQKPEATLVAGYSTWSRKFNRHVKRGEKGIKIIAPAPVRKKEEREKYDPETGEPILRPDGQPETEEVEHVIPRFRVATVFDISQTDGEPLPELDTPELAGNVENFDIFMEAIGMVSPAPVRYAEIAGDAKGYYSSTGKEIVLREGMSEKQTMKTAIHEAAHAMCHDRDVMKELGEKKDRMTKEVEAESIAFTVCSFFGLDVSGYSFPYIAGWSGGMDMKELRSSMDFIRETAGFFIDGMVGNIRKLQKEKEAEREEREQLLEAGQQIPEKLYPPLYIHSLSYAMEHGRVDDYMESRKLNLDCKKAVEDAIRENFDGMRLAHGAAGEVLEQYGAERVAFVLANTVQHLDYDGRFSPENKAWAKGFEIPENTERGRDMNAAYIVSSHPAVLDGFIRLAREGMREREQVMETQINGETKGFLAEGHFGTWHTVEAQEIQGEMFYRMEHDEYGGSVASIIVSQDGRLVAEDLEHGFGQGAMEAIDEYFVEKGSPMETDTDREISGGSRKQSVLDALRERQARLKLQEQKPQAQEKQAQKKGERGL